MTDYAALVTPGSRKRGFDSTFYPNGLLNKATRITGAEIYQPTLQERVRRLLGGYTGLLLEMLNFLFSIGLFFVYVAELYVPELEDSAGCRIAELVLVLFFLFDLILHLIAAINPLRYLLTISGVVDVVTIFPPLIVVRTFAAPNGTSEVLVLLRALRVFRALRVRRLKRVLGRRDRPFRYELIAFLLSSIAAVLCAAGIYYQLEDGHGSQFEFHDSLYFILVSISTVGYGDMSPNTLYGKIFVILLIVGIFTFVPQQVSKLNDLAKHTHSWDESYSRISNFNGHVIVAGPMLTFKSVEDFLTEFYHETRGSIHLDVVFVGINPPDPSVVKLLDRERFRRRTCYLKGSLSSFGDQQRCQLSESVAVFLLSDQENTNTHAMDKLLLDALAVRNAFRTGDDQPELYLDFQAHQQHQLGLLGMINAYVLDRSNLQTQILAKAATCPGSGTLLANLLRSSSRSPYKEEIGQTDAWVEEYVHGLTNQIFPVVLDERFEDEPFEDAAKYFYQHYSVLFIGLCNDYRDECAARDTEEKKGGKQVGIRLAPFGVRLHRGDKAIVIAPDSTTIVKLMSSYHTDGCALDFERLNAMTANIRVSTDSLIRRQTPFSRSSVSSLYPTLSDIFGSSSSPENDPSPSKVASKGSTDVEVDESNQAESEHVQDPNNVVQEVSVRECIRAETRDLSGHFVIASSDLKASVSLCAEIRQLLVQNKTASPSNNSTTPNLTTQAQTTTQEDAQFVLLTRSLTDVENTANEMKDEGIAISDYLAHLAIVKGDAAHLDTFKRVAASKARAVLLLPERLSCNGNPDTTTHPKRECQDPGSVVWESNRDIHTINALWSLKSHELYEPFKSRCGSSSLIQRSHSMASPRKQPPSGSVGFNNTANRYRHDESSTEDKKASGHIFLARISRAISNALERDDDNTQASTARRSRFTSEAQRDLSQRPTRDPATNRSHQIAVLHDVSSIKYCWPVSNGVDPEANPYLSPAFAEGQAFMCSVMDQMTCQLFFNPYIVDVIEALTGSTGPDLGVAGAAGSLSRVEIDDEFYGDIYLSLFLYYLQNHKLVLGLMRNVHPDLENELPFVYTCPAHDTIIHKGDSVFVLS